MKKLLLWAAATALSSLTLTAELHAGTVKMWTFLNPNNNSGLEVALRNIVTEFEKENPQIDVVVEPQAWATMSEKFVLSHSTNTAPDIIWSAKNLGLLVNSGSLAPLNPYLGGWDGPEGGDLLFKKAYENATYDGNLMAVPIFAYAVLLFYRKDIFEELGLTEESIATWDGLIETARKLKAAGKPGLLVPTSVDKPSEGVAADAYVQLNGGQMFDEGCVANFASENGLRALELQVRMFKEGILSQEDLVRNNDDDWDLFKGGRGAIIPQVNDRAGALFASTDWANEKTVGITRWPNFPGETEGSAVGAAWQASLWTGSQNKEEAAKFILFMVSKFAARQWAREGKLLPIRASIATDPEFSGGIYEFNKKAGKLVEETGVFQRPGCNFSPAVVGWNTAVQEVVLNNADPMEVLKKVSADVNRRQ
uniref:Carbohydrate ABC transporter substrate-binding protein, CUT1 family n=1 Tax=Chelativorans sp. (strain BNC1) TaxID=266779 RepID=Q11FZ0_CHESB